MYFMGCVGKGVTKVAIPARDKAFLVISKVTVSDALERIRGMNTLILAERVP